MFSLTLADLVPWVIKHGYIMFFIAALIEGPFVTIAAGVAAGFGYFNIFLVILISIAGNVTADVIYYFIGYFSRNLIIENHGHRFGLTKDRLDKIDKMVHRNFKKGMLVVKLSPIIPIPGLIGIGSTRVSLKRFIRVTLVITFATSTFYSLLGFYSLKTYKYLAHTVTNSTYVVGVVVLLVILIYYFYSKITAKYSKDNGFN